MTYTVKLDFFIDDDEIRTNKQIVEIIEEIFDNNNCSASNVIIYDIND